MPNITRIDQLFGEIAVDMKYLDQSRMDRAMVVQRCIFKRTKVHMPIGKVLKEMGLLTQEQVDAILDAQRNLDKDDSDNGKGPMQPTALNGIDLSVSKDKLGVFLSPSGEDVKGVTLQTVKQLLAGRGIVYGVVRDQAIEAYLAQDPLPLEPFQIACGTPPIEGHPPEIRFLFDTEPLRVGTLNEDGTMDWKNRGRVPEVKTGDLLAEKTGGDPGTPGTNVLGEEIAPPRIREPQLKCARGAQRSEDGKQVTAKVDGTPKLSPDGRITVMAMLPIEGDVGVETGHIDFDGYIEVNGGICTGYNVKGRGLRTKEIQNAKVELSEDLVSFGGIYGSTVKVDGDAKASHVHNTEMSVLGDLIVDKEIFGCNIEVNGRCIISDGKIIGSKISAKKGVIVQDIGTEASLASEIIVGIDRRYERDMQVHKETLAALEKQQADLTTGQTALREQLDKINTELGDIAQEQDKCMVQRRQLEEKLRGPKAVKDEEERNMVAKLVEELGARNEAYDKQVNDYMERDDQIRAQLDETAKKLVQTHQQIEALKNEMTLLDEALKVDPGVPVVKVSGTVFAKTSVAGLNRKLIIPKDMRSVRIAESKNESTGNKWEIAISPLR